MIIELFLTILAAIGFVGVVLSIFASIAFALAGNWPMVFISCVAWIVFAAIQSIGD